MSLASQDVDRGLRERGAIIMGIFALIWAMAGSSGFANDEARYLILIVALVVTGAVVLRGLHVDRQPARDRPRRLPANWNERYFRVGIA